MHKSSLGGHRQLYSINMSWIVINKRVKSHCSSLNVKTVHRIFIYVIRSMNIYIFVRVICTQDGGGWSSYREQSQLQVNSQSRISFLFLFILQQVCVCRLFIHGWMMSFRVLSLKVFVHLRKKLSNNRLPTFVSGLRLKYSKYLHW